MSNPTQTYSVILGAREYRSATPLTIGGNGNYRVGIARFSGQTMATSGRITSNSPIFVSEVQ
jgi:hypothetical protein